MIAFPVWSRGESNYAQAEDPSHDDKTGYKQCINNYCNTMYFIPVLLDECISSIIKGESNYATAEDQ